MERFTNVGRHAKMASVSDWKDVTLKDIIRFYVLELSRTYTRPEIATMMGISSPNYIGRALSSKKNFTIDHLDGIIKNHGKYPKDSDAAISQFLSELKDIIVDIQSNALTKKDLEAWVLNGAKPGRRPIKPPVKPTDRKKGTWHGTERRQAARRASDDEGAEAKRPTKDRRK